MNTLEKLLTVGIFSVLLFFLIDYIMGIMVEKISLNDITPNIKYYLCAMGIFDAVNIYVSFLIASWFANKIINFLSS